MIAGLPIAFGAPAILFGLLLSVIIIFLLLKNWGATLTAIVVIPVSVLVTVLAMKLLHMSFNLMTLGGMAAAVQGSRLSSN